MENVVAFIDGVFDRLEKVNFALLVTADLASFGGVCLVCIVACLASVRLRCAGKRPFFHLSNAFAAVTLALFCLRYDMPRAVLAAAVVWLVGYLVYGVLCAITPSKAPAEALPPLKMATGQPLSSAYSPPKAPPAHTAVRLEHALSITEKLLAKNLGRGDRQELDKMKTALTLLRAKDALTPADGEALNEMFNTLLKLMARYDL